MIWTQCEGERYMTQVSGTLYRMVVSQEPVATWHYVDNLEEQGVLEALLETSQPPVITTESQHDLLTTPFRYPPLQWGSRFGRTHEPSLFYAGGSIEATLAETAFYRLVFWYSMNAPPAKDTLMTEHTLFRVDYHSEQGIRLQHPPFSDYQADLTHPKDYTRSQALGTDMRAAGVEAFEYVSARDPQQGLCVGLFTPQPFCQTQPKNTQSWLCELRAQSVRFKALDQRPIYHFDRDLFWIDGALPQPA